MKVYAEQGLNDVRFNCWEEMSSSQFYPPPFACTNATLYCTRSFQSSCMLTPDLGNQLGFDCAGRCGEYTPPVQMVYYSSMYPSNTIKCHGRYKCFGALLVCNTPYCTILCHGASSCEDAIVDASNNTVQNVYIELRQNRAGAGMYVWGLDRNFTTTDDLYYRDSLYIYIDITHTEGFAGGRVHATYNSDVRVQCGGYRSCIDTHFATANSDQLYLYCGYAALRRNRNLLNYYYPEGDQCAGSTVYCPTSDDCYVYCTNYEGSCANMTILNVNGAQDNVDEWCDPERCGGMEFYCGMGLELYWKANFSCGEGCQMHFGPCGGQYDLNFVNVYATVGWSGYTPDYNYHIADYPHKFSEKHIFCDWHTEGTVNCVVIAGINGYVDDDITPDAIRSNITVFSNPIILYLYGHSRKSFAYSYIDAHLAKGMRVIAQTHHRHNRRTFEHATILSANWYELYCETAKSCQDLNFHATWSISYSSGYSYISCLGDYACRNGYWNLTDSDNVTVTCGNGESTCTGLKLIAPSMNDTDSALFPQVKIDCSQYSTGPMSHTCSNMTLYAQTGNKNMNLRCWDRIIQPSRRMISQITPWIGDFACINTTIYCTPLFEFDCEIQADSFSRLGYTCKNDPSSLCLNYSYEEYREIAPTSAPTTIPTSVHITPMCDNSTNFCFFNCTGNYRCSDAILNCTAHHCRVLCDGSHACSSVTIIADSITVHTLEIELLGTAAGKDMTIYGSPTYVKDTDELIARVDRGDNITVNILVAGERAFLGGEVYGSYGLFLSMSCISSQGCADAAIYTSEADRIQINCGSSASCDSLTVFCPVSAAVYNNNSNCLIDCTGANNTCDNIQLFNIGGLTKMDLMCNPVYSQCTDASIYCGKSFDQFCYLSENQDYNCSTCGVDLGLPSNIPRYNWFIAEYPFKYATSIIRCYGGSNEECMIIAGVTSLRNGAETSDVNGANIEANYIGTISLYALSTQNFYQAQLNAAYAQNVVLITQNPARPSRRLSLQTFGYPMEQFRYMSITLPQRTLYMLCWSPWSCADTAIFTQEVSDLEVSSTDIQNQMVVDISCLENSACAASQWDFQLSNIVNITCASYNASCADITLFAPIINQTLPDNRAPVQMDCQYYSFYDVPSCYNVSMYAIHGSKDVNWTCHRIAVTRRQLLDYDFGCQNSEFFCSPQYEMSCELEPTIDYEGYSCAPANSICVNYSYANWLLVAPTSSPTIAPTVFSIVTTCTDDNNCTLLCHGDYSCQYKQLNCSAKHCRLECYGQEACEGVVLDAKALTVSTLHIELDGYMSGYGMTIVGYDTNFNHTNELLERVRMKLPLHMSLNVRGDYAFAYSSLLASHETHVEVECWDGEASCNRANFAVSDAESLKLKCGPSFYSCESARVFCPTAASVYGDPSRCQVNCPFNEQDGYDCSQMQIYSLNGFNGMNLTCNTESGQCSDAQMWCGNIYEHNCWMYASEGPTYMCSYCDGLYNGDPLFNASGMTSFNYFVADIPGKYRGAHITCLDTSRASDCRIIAGVSYSQQIIGFAANAVAFFGGDAMNSTISASLNSTTAVLSIVSYYVDDFVYAYIDASLASEAQVLAVSPYFYGWQLGAATLITPRFSLNMACLTRYSCWQLRIQEPELSIIANAVTANITCEDMYSCGFSTFDLRQATNVQVDCQYPMHGEHDFVLADVGHDAIHI
ncbi:hypothetical protein RFI_11771 [Reticulomyxa filosa]|uniref:Uncharacterized protein n=1 Tax=Reticulomyxa filosa TaxID=46433 RepID=X6NJ72_RETFI|nr:hypothetical protein RFI_11771 [Reticulomyxa filosa]|eukprot:ETO25367.1 hypothetical protein RFI_11771 [Reticulomyxa filosa]